MSALIVEAGDERGKLVERAVELARQRRLTDVEIYRKRGRSRLFEIEWHPGENSDRPVSHQVRDRHEAGWAIRYGNRRGRSFVCGSGEFPPNPPLTAPRGGRLVLPQTPGPEPRRREPSALVSETQAVRSLASLAEALPPPLVDRRIQMQDGRAGSVVANNHELSAAWLHRTGLVTLEERLPGGAVLRLHAVTENATAAFESAAQLWPRVVSLVHRVRWRPPRSAVAADDENDGAEGDEHKPSLAVEGDRVSVVVSPDAAGPLVAEAVVSWVSEARETTVASPVIQVCDAPDWPQGPMSTQVDGQGQPAVRRTVVQAGRLVAGLGDPEVAVVRRGWRDLPLAGYQQPVLLPGSAGEDELIAGVKDGWWLAARIEVPAIAEASRPKVFVGRRIVRGAIDSSGDPRLLILHTGATGFCRWIRELAGEIRFQPSRTGVIGVPALSAEGVRITVV